MKNNSQFEMNAEYFHYSDRLKIISTDESLKISRKSVLKKLLVNCGNYIELHPAIICQNK